MVSLELFEVEIGLQISAMLFTVSSGAYLEVASYPTVTLAASSALVRGRLQRRCANALPDFRGIASLAPAARSAQRANTHGFSANV
ncbi:MAG: hypothetical protein AUI91_12540 [Acidobacteria bacterium 13_1_40CM_3_56_11]|nr:MAG: hypothetical protein AUH28_19090 [Acidobacteria bacterium 13_1_40CM_56_16]OLD17321.1 MAG: hypothetical protein AUI91_12540 [Acidobacteria bacterium 13_1_40CM_3_56_11]OLD71643.1 MAG: hypothetical protein AUI45_01070 [Acidobacteria bacterium 13_1_40CM_2_56_11]